MPIYEYICPKCGNKMEKLSPVCNSHDEEIYNCHCGESMTRTISAASFNAYELKFARTGKRDRGSYPKE